LITLQPIGSHHIDAAQTDAYQVRRAVSLPMIKTMAIATICAGSPIVDLRIRRKARARKLTTSSTIFKV
jgi:hypothetical protein